MRKEKTHLKLILVFKSWLKKCEPSRETTKAILMKIVHKTKSGETREALLKEYFITASLIALLKRVGQEAAKAAPRRAEKPVPARIRY